ncbi:cation-transporting P-type ATPase, partial [Accumulibacter sp.]
MRDEPARVAWHFLAAEEVALRLEASCADGLGEAEVIGRRAVHGENRISPRARKGPLRRFALQFVQPLVVVLL